MTNPDQPTVGDLTARLEFRYENDPLDFLKTGKGYLVVDDKVANIPLPTGKKGDRGDDGRLSEGDVRYFNRRTDEAEAAAEASEASAARSKASEEAAKDSETEAKASEANAKAAATRAEDAQAEVELVVEDSAGAIREHVKDDADRADRAATKAAEHEAGAERAASEATRVEVDKLIAGAPEAFDTLKEISDELEKNETERAALATSIGEKARREEVDSALASKSNVGHVHSVSEVNGLDTALAGAGQTAQWSQVSDKPSAFPPEGHRHPVDQIDNLDALIDQRARALDTDWVQVTGPPSNPQPNTIYFEVE